MEIESTNISVWFHSLAFMMDIKPSNKILRNRFLLDELQHHTMNSKCLHLSGNAERYWEDKIMLKQGSEALVC